MVPPCAVCSAWAQTFGTQRSVTAPRTHTKGQAIPRGPLHQGGSAEAHNTLAMRCTESRRFVEMAAHHHGTFGSPVPKLQARSGIQVDRTRDCIDGILHNWHEG